MPKTRKQASRKNCGKPEEGCYMTRSRARKIDEGNLSVGTATGSSSKHGGSSASHRPQSSSKLMPGKDVCSKVNNSKKKQKGPRMLKKSGVSPKALRNGDQLNGTAVPRLSRTKPKLHRSPAISSRPFQASAAKALLETRALQVVTSNHEKTLERLEAWFNLIQHHITEVLPVQLDTILVHADSLIDNLREQFIQDYEYLRERINRLHRAQQYPPNNLRITIS